MHASAFAHPQLRLVFIGGGNMASAILGGLIKEGLRPDQVTVVAPTEATRARLSAQFGVHTLGAAGPELAGADVVVSGHTHRGQVFPATLLIKYFQAYPYGHYRVGDTQLVVTSGYGLWGLPFRLGARSEVAMIELIGK